MPLVHMTERGLPLLRIDVGNKRWLAKQYASQRQPHHPDAAESNEQDRSALGVTAQSFKGAIGGKPRAHQWTGERRRQRRMVEQITRVRHQYVSCETAVDGNAKMMMCGAHILFAGATGRSGAAANPGIHRDLSSDFGAVGIFPGRFNDAGDLVPKRKRQSAVFGDIEAFLAAEREMAVLHMQI